MSDDWHVNEEIRVDIQQLKDFADAIQRELESNFKPSYDGGLRPMLDQRASFGYGGLKEARFFRDRREESRLALSYLMADVMRGLESLSAAARSISAEYANGDAMVEATHDDVFNAFSAVNGQETLSGDWQSGGGNPTNGGPGIQEPV